MSERSNVSLLISPRVMKLQERWDATEKLLENVALLLECRPIWARMHRDAQFETPLYDLLRAAEQGSITMKAEQDIAVAEMLKMVRRNA